MIDNLQFSVASPTRFHSHYTLKRQWWTSGQSRIQLLWTNDDLSEDYFLSVKGLGELGNESCVWDWKWSVWLRRSRNRKPYGKGLRRGRYINSYFMILQSKFLSVALVHESKGDCERGRKRVHCIVYHSKGSQDAPGNHMQVISNSKHQVKLAI